jgi:hypothetical protein
MRFTSASAVLALAASVFAQTPDFDPIYTPASNAELEAGSTFEVTWAAPAKYADGTITIELIGGVDQDHQVPIAVVATGVANSANKYSWTVGADLGDAAVYGLRFKLESNPEIFQYSNPFHIKASASKPDYSLPAESSADVTLTTSEGAVTYTLSSVAVTSSAPEVTSTSAVYSTPVVTYSSVVIPTSSAVHQNSTLISSVKPVVPSTSTSVVVPPPAESSSVVTPPPASAASARSVSGALAVVAGLAMAALAL